MTRYVAVQEPTCTWAVFDTLNDVPAELGGDVLIGLERTEALGLALSANDDRAPGVALAFRHGGLRMVVRRAI